MEKTKNSIEWQKVHIFISSTFNDMHAERDYLVKKVFPELQEWCEQRKLRLVDIDLRWGVTEQDATNNRNAVKVCLERIDDCRPFFLCFIGQRRGWVPNKDEVSADTYDHFPELRNYIEKSSITELEILHALITPLHRGIKYDEKKLDEKYEKVQHAFFYLRDGSYLDKIPAEPLLLRETYTNEGEKPEDRVRHDQELEKWREDLKKIGRHYTAEWNGEASTPEIMLPLSCPSTDPRNIARWQKQWAKAGIEVMGVNIEEDSALAEKAGKFNELFCSGRLAEFASVGKELKDVILKDLKTAIAARYPDHIEKVEESELQKELDQQEEFLYINSEGFIEREGVFSELDDYLNDDSRQLFVLTAPGGMGKSMLLANWIDRCKGQPGADYTLHFRFVGQSDRSTNLPNLLRYLLLELQQIAHKIPATAMETVKGPEGNETTREVPFDIPQDPIKLQTLWQEQLVLIGEKGKTVIVIDAINQLESGFDELTWLPLSGLPENIKLIISFRQDATGAPELLERFTANGEYIRLARVKPFVGMKDRRTLVNTYLNQYLKEIDARHLEVITALKGAENPLFLKVVLSELRVFGSFVGLADKIRSDFGDTPESAFDGTLRRLENDPAYSGILPGKAVPLLFGLMAHARYGLSAEELAGMFRQSLSLAETEDQKALTLETVHLFLRQVRPFLARRDGRFDFFYESFKNAALERYVKGRPAEPTTNRPAQEWHRILAGYFGSLPLWESKEQFKPTKRKVAELPYHQTMGEMWKEVEKTLSDPMFCEARCRTGGPFELISDCRYALEFQAISAISVTKRAIITGLNAMLERPDLCLQTLINRLDWLAGDEPVVRAAVQGAMGHLDKRGCWVQAYSPYPRMDMDSLLVPFQSEAQAQCLSADERCIVVLGEDRSVRIIDLNQGSLRESYGCPEVTGHVASIQKIEPSGRLAWLDQGGVLRVAHCTETLQVRHGENRIAFLPAHGLVAVDKSGALVAWNPDSRRSTVLAKELPAPVKVLRTVGATGLLLCVAGNNPQRVLLVATDARIELRLNLVWREAPIVDADVDASAQTILLLCRDRSLRRIETKGGEQLAKPFYYEQGKPTPIWGAPARCALGSSSSAGWGFLATCTGQIGAWNWQSCELRQLPDWRTEQQGFLNLFTCLCGSGHLVVGLQSEARLLTQSSQRDRQRTHQAPVNACVVTDKGQVVSASEHDGTACWFADPPGLHLRVRQNHPGLTAVAAIPASNDVLLGNSAGWCWRQPPDREVSREEVFCLFDRRVAALASLDSKTMVAADVTGCTMLLENGSDDPILLRHGSGSVRQIALLPATGAVACWSLHAAAENGETSHRLSLLEGIKRETEVLRVSMRTACFTCASDQDLICLGSDYVRLFRVQGHKKALALFQRKTGVDFISFVGDGQQLAVILHEVPWLEIWSVVPGLPTIAAADLPGTVTSFAVNGDWMVVGFESGQLLRLRLRGLCINNHLR